ncbi:MAG: M18 family aminopeptidase [Lachnospiraceae bacterium]|nr:M18 family aminopeptidase [Lachnospiraceae bacterium]
MKEAKKRAQDMLKFIEACPSCYHVVARLGETYEKNGFIRLDEKEAWELEWGKSYFVTRNDSAIIAFRLPLGKEEVKGYHVAAAHCDSPSFKIKENPQRNVAGKCITLNVEKYGGMIHSTWMDRPLSVAGRLAVENEHGEIETKLVCVDRDLLVIPSLAIHMNRDVNKGVELKPQTDLQPLFAMQEEKDQASAFMKVVAKAAGVKPEQILGHDLFLYVRDKGRVFGANDEFVLSPKLDDLQCVYAVSEGLVRACENIAMNKYINVAAVFDNEEVGSGSNQGADSTFFEDVLLRMGEALSVSPSTQRQWIASGFLISADNAHAVHPNHPEKADPTNQPCLNGGPVLKFNSAQKYTTDGVTAAMLRRICKLAGVPCQTYVNHSDVPGGSTLGNISTSHVSIPSADIGMPQLAMHSAVETGGTLDTDFAIKLMQQFFSE